MRLERNLESFDNRASEQCRFIWYEFTVGWIKKTINVKSFYWYNGVRVSTMTPSDVIQLKMTPSDVIASPITMKNSYNHLRIFWLYKISV